MSLKKNRLIRFLLNAVMIILAAVIQYNGAFTVKIGTANPMLPLCVLIAICMFCSELEAVTAAFFTGIIADSAAATPIGFNTIIMMIIALGVSLAVHYLFNNNIRAVAALAAAGSLVYFLVRWLFVFSEQSLSHNLEYLLRFAMPSVVYSTVLIIPLYYLERRIHTIKR